MADKYFTADIIHTRFCEECYLCGRQGDLLYQGLVDSLFGVPGKWDFRICTDKKCGFIWLDRVPIEEEIGKVYQTYYTHTSSKPPKSTSSSFYQMVWNGYLRTNFGYTQGVGSSWHSMLAPLANIYPTGPSGIASNVMFLSSPSYGAKLLDVGCGDGSFLYRMHGMGWHVEGNEIDPKAAAVAQSKGITVRIGDLVRQEYASDHFDAITMNHVIEHVYKPIEFLKEAKRILKHTGQLVLLTPNAYSFGHCYFKQDWRGLEPPRHFHIFAPQSIRRAFLIAGFTQIKVVTLTRGARYILSMSRAIQKNRLNKSDLLDFSGPEKKLLGMLYQFGERALHLFQRHRGEELLVIAQK
jgi:2-polyprenyl-3-methyl-5-hydroxy-6-metoxy-1,4-benzoquinol methylase